MSFADQYDIPVAFFIFNRPDVTKKTFERISQIRPKELFLIADGPRCFRNGEDDLVRETRRIVSEIDWPCIVKTNYSEINIGCRDRMHTGITWVFSNVERAIILEDDCLPSMAFFDFVKTMLDRYKDDYSVYSIAGSSFTGKIAPQGYIYSDYSLMWGWATWRSRWEKYSLMPDNYIRTVVFKWWKRPIDMIYWLTVFHRIKVGRLNSAWDYQWILTLWRESGRCIRPSVNLIRNEGFGEDATHTKSGDRFSDIGFYEGDASPLKKHSSNIDILKASEKADRELWAMINIRSVILLIFPFMKILKRNKR